MRKQTEQLLIVAGVIGFVWFASNGGLQQQAVVQQDGGTQVDGVTIYTGTPTLEWYATDAVTGQSVAPAHFRVIINGSQSEEVASASAIASIGDPFTICLMPNTTYLGVCETSTVQKTVVKVDLEAYAVGTATIWINNDPENATARNANSAAKDTLGASDTDTATVCVQGSTANASFGDGSILVSIDYNSMQLETAPTLSVGNLCSGCMPSAYSRDANATASVFYEVGQLLTNQDTVCGTMTVQNDSTDDTDAAETSQHDPRVSVFDRAYFRHSVTDALVQDYARPTSGADTNSCTNATAVYYYIA